MSKDFCLKRIGEFLLQLFEFDDTEGVQVEAAFYPSGLFEKYHDRSILTSSPQSMTAFITSSIMLLLQGAL